MTEVWVLVVRVALAVGIGTLALPLLALVATRLIGAHERHYVWRAALFTIVAGIALAASGIIPVDVSLPAAAARAAHELGLPITERVTLAGTSASITHSIIRFGAPHPAAYWFVVIWLAGSALLAFGFVRHYRAAAALVRATVPASPGVREALLAALPREPGLRFDIRTAERGTPAFVWGVRAPCIILPMDVIESPASAIPILVHELEHVRSRDLLVQALSDAVVCLAWWQPLAWILRARIRREREFAADAAVLASGISAEVYGTALLGAASAQRTLAPTASQGSNLALRIERIAQWRGAARQRWFAKVGITAVAALIALTLALAGADLENPAGSFDESRSPAVRLIAR